MLSSGVNLMMSVSEKLMMYYLSRKRLIEERMKEIVSLTTKFDPVFKETEAYDMVMYGIHGGKKLRGVLTLLTCEALGGNIDKALDAAVAVEFVHNASLIHDDVIDGDEERRGRESFWKKYGVTAAIISGHYLISLSLSIFRKYGWKAVEAFNKAWMNTLKGGIIDIWKGKTFDEKLYKIIAKLKTGEFFAIASLMGAIAAEKENYEKIAYMYGSQLGFAFQIADDIVDLVKLQSNKNILLHSLSLPAFVAWVLEGKIKGIKKISLISSEDLLKIIKENNVLEKALNKLKDKVAEVEKIASLFPENTYSMFLKEIPKLAIKKMLSEAPMISKFII